MSDLIISNIDGQLLVDSRLIAERLGIQHETVVKHLKKYATQFQAMGNLRFEIGASAPNSNGARHQVSFALLNEPQSTFLMTLSKNTDLVVQCKLDLVIAFEKAKQLIATVIPAQSDRIKELELELAIRQLDSTMMTLHGTEAVLALRGMSAQVIHVEVPVTEIVEPLTGRNNRILTADQLKLEVKKRTGQNLPSLKWFADALRNSGRDDLLVAVTRHSTSEYPIPEKLDEAIAVVYAAEQQRLIGQ